MKSNQKSGLLLPKKNTFVLQEEHLRLPRKPAGITAMTKNCDLCAIFSPNDDAMPGDL
jgi:hypothetical protein